MDDFLNTDFLCWSLVGNAEKAGLQAGGTLLFVYHVGFVLGTVVAFLAREVRSRMGFRILSLVT